MKTEYKPHTPRLKIVDQYIRDLFKDELPDAIKYHDANHTLHPTRGVVAVANKLALSEGVSDHDRELLIAAAYFHDTGYIRAFEKNEPIAARMAGRILKLIGYRPNEIKKIKEMIRATDFDLKPKTHLEKILCDADLDNLGREDFFELDQRLRQGRAARGLDVSDDLKWYQGTLKVVQNYAYYTETQRKLREKGRQDNIKMLLSKLEALETKQK